MPIRSDPVKTFGDHSSLLIGIVGRRDTWSCFESRMPGPVLSILEARPEFTDVLLLHSGEKDLQDRAECLREGAFREDLYYRISVAPLRVPDLNDRPGDIVLLALHLLHEFNQINKQTKHLSPEALIALKGHRWRGNIRELDGVIKRAAMRARGDEVREADLSLGGYVPAMENGSLPVPHEGFILEEHLKRTRQALMDKALELADKNQSKAARMLGVSPQAVQQYVSRRDGN